MKKSFPWLSRSKRPSRPFALLASLLGALCCVGCSFEVPRLHTHPDDAGPSDSGVEVDGAMPQSSDGKGCKSRQPAPTFCDDFDGKPYQQIWAASGVSPRQEAGTLAKDGLDFVSPENSLYATFSGNSPTDEPSGAGVGMFFNRDTNEPVTIRVAFDLKVDGFDARSGATTSVFALQFLGDARNENEYGVLLESSSGKLGVRLKETFRPNGNEMNEEQVLGTLHTELDLSKWSHVEFVFDVLHPGKSGNHLKLTIDGKVVFDGGTKYPLNHYPSIDLGLHDVDASQYLMWSWMAHLDNFVLDFQPE